MKTSSRRTFLQRSSVAAAVLWAHGQISWGRLADSGQVQAWITAGQDRLKKIDVPSWEPAPGMMTQDAVVIDASQRLQSILGFGGAFTDASCYLFSRMEPQQRTRLLEEFFGQNGLRLSVGRTCIGSSDYSRNAYSYDDSSVPDPELKNFSIVHDRAYILPTLHLAQALNPEMFFFAAPWSPPGWMKANDSLLGGSMRKTYFAAYAQYFVKFLQAYKAEGVQIEAVTTQNEVDTDQDGRMPAALWGQEYEAGFIKGFLGPALQQSAPGTKIWLLDHNYDLWGRVMDQLSDPGLAKYVDGVAWHGYMGTPDTMSKVHNAFPDKGTYWTEGGSDFNAPDYASDWTTWAGKYAAILKNWARCIVAWNFVLDEKGAPNIGPFYCGGLVTLDSKTQEITRSGQYWAFAHYSREVRRGARVLSTSGGASGVGHVAFVNPDRSYVLVLTNSGLERDVECAMGGKRLKVHLPHQSVVTLKWS
jgi:glucosylceramidase